VTTVTWWRADRWDNVSRLRIRPPEVAGQSPPILIHSSRITGRGTAPHVGRLVSVFAGALAGVALVAWDPPSGVYAVATAGAVAAAAGTHPSRWYVTAGFTTFLVFLIYLSADPDTAGERFGERVGETLLGVALAALFGMAGSRRPEPG